MKHSLLRAWFFIFVLLFSGAADAEQFACEFSSEIKPIEPLEAKAQASTIKKRFGFYVDEPGKASYVNLDGGWKGEVTAIRFSAGWSFLERNMGDNFFVATVFTHKKVKEKFPAIMSVHALDIPSQLYGLCGW